MRPNGTAEFRPFPAVSLFSENGIRSGKPEGSKAKPAMCQKQNMSGQLAFADRDSRGNYNGTQMLHEFLDSEPVVDAEETVEHKCGDIIGLVGQRISDWSLRACRNGLRRPTEIVNQDVDADQ